MADKSVEVGMVSPGPAEAPLVFNVMQLIQEGKLEEVVEPVKGYKVTMHTLTVGEQDQIRKENGKDLFAMAADEIAQNASMWVSVLTNSITNINGRDFQTPADKQELADVLKKCQQVVFSRFVEAWVALLTKQSSIFSDETVKKNS